jgi:hypothetical protein
MPVNYDEIESYLAAKFNQPDDSESIEALKESQRQARLAAGLGRAGNTIGAALGGIKADNSFYDQMDANAASDFKAGMDRRSAGEARKMAVAEYLQKKKAGDESLAYQKSKDDRSHALELAKLGQKDTKIAAERPYEYVDSEGNVRTGRYVEGKGPLQSSSDPLAVAKGKTNVPQTYEERIKALSADQRGRFDNSTMALRSVKSMADALLNKNQNTFSILGDNDYTLSRTQWEEAIGRMQSGGAINDDEAKRFRAMAPGPTDSAEIQRKKLAEMETLMSQRIQNLGFDTNEAMGRLSETEKKVALPAGKSDGTAFAGPKKMPSPQDIDAYNWAKQNPNDPKAQGILEKLQKKGVL